MENPTSYLTDSQINDFISEHSEQINSYEKEEDFATAYCHYKVISYLSKCLYYKRELTYSQYLECCEKHGVKRGE